MTEVVTARDRFVRSAILTALFLGQWVEQSELNRRVRILRPWAQDRTIVSVLDALWEEEGIVETRVVDREGGQGLIAQWRVDPRYRVRLGPQGAHVVPRKDDP